MDGFFTCNITQDAGRDTWPRASLLAAAGVVNPLAAGVSLHISSCEDFMA